MTRAVLGALGALAVLALAVPVAAAATDDDPAIVLSRTTGLDPAGDTITVTGTGFDPAANVGTRPPFAGQPSGVYVVFGRFAENWRPSAGAPSSARQVIHQVWALPRAQHDMLNPTGTNPEITLLEADGTFSAQLPVSAAEGSGAYAVATYPASGAVNPSQELLVPVSLAAPGTTTSSTTTSSTTSTSTTTTTTAPTTTAPTTTVPPAGGSGTRSATGGAGQTLSVTPSDGLDPAGSRVAVTGSGYDTAVGVYVALCVDQGPAAAPSPCVGGVDMEGSGSSSAWISSNPPSYAGDLATPFGSGGSFAVQLDIAAADEFVDCLAAGTRCVVATRADHTASSNRSADVRVPVYFAGQTPPDREPEDPQPTLSLDTTTVRAGESLSVRGEAFLPGEQVQIWILSDPVLLGVAMASERASVTESVTIPADLAPGVHHIELRGLTSGRVVRSTELTVLAAEATPISMPDGSSPEQSVPGAVAAATDSPLPGSSLALTGAGLGAAALGAVLLLAGSIVLLASRRTGANR